MWEQPAFAWTLPIRNNSDQEIEIERFTKSCTCASIEPSSATIARGETHNFRLTLDLRSSRPDTMGERDFRVGIAPIIRGKTNIGAAWQIEGKVRSALRFTMPPNLGEHSEEAQPIPPVKIEIVALVPLSGLSVISSDAAFTAQLQPISGRPDAYELTVKPSGRLAQGTIDLGLTLTPTVAAGEPVSPYTLPVRGRIVPDIQAVPPVIALGSRHLKETVSDSVALVSLTGRPIEVESWEIRGTGIVVNRLSKPQNSFEISQRVIERDHQSNLVVFCVRSPSGKTIIEVPVRYHGLDGPGGVR